MKFLLGVLLGGVMFVQGQEWSSIELSDFQAKVIELEKVKKDNESYAVEGEYQFYERHIGGEVAYRFPLALKVKYKDNQVYMEQLGRVMVQNDKMLVTCDDDSRQLIIQPPNTGFYQQRMTGDFDPLLNSDTKAKYRKSGRLEIYRLEFVQGALYEALELWVNTTKNSVEKYVMYAKEQIADDFKEEVEYIQPRMEIVYSNYTFGSAVDKQQFPSPEKYFSDWKLLIPTSEYSEYEIIDLRNQN